MSHKGLDERAIDLLPVLIGHGTVQKVFWGLNFRPGFVNKNNDLMLTKQ